MLIVILDVGCLSASLFVSLFVCFLACLVLTQTSREMDLFGLEGGKWIDTMREVRGVGCEGGEGGGQMD